MQAYLRLDFFIGLSPGADPVNKISCVIFWALWLVEKIWAANQNALAENTQ